MVKLIATAAAIAALYPAATAAAEDYPQWVYVIRDCASNGKLDGTYDHSALAEALRRLPSDGGEYSDCAMAIQHALVGGSGKPNEPPPVNGVVTDSGAVAASPEDVWRLQAVITDATEPAPAARPRPAEARSDATFSGIDQATSPGYRVDVRVLEWVLTLGGIALTAASLMRRLRGRLAS